MSNTKQLPRYYHDPDGSKMRAREHWIDEMMATTSPSDRTIVRGYLELVYDNEQAPMTTDYQQLTAAGFQIAPPETLSDEEIPRHLERLLDELANMQVEVMEADHLSPREMYRRLVEQSLREERPDAPMIEGGWTVIDTAFMDSIDGLDDYNDNDDNDNDNDQDNRADGGGLGGRRVQVP